MKFFLILLISCFLGISGSAAVKKPQNKVSTPSGQRVLSAQQDAELKDWIIGIQKLAQDSETKADAAEKEAAIGRSMLSAAQDQLKEANTNADTLQSAIKAQSNQLDKAIAAKDSAEAREAKTTKQNNFLKTIIGLEAGAAVALLLLWLGVPALSPPYGLIATVAGPIVVFGLFRLFL